MSNTEQAVSRQTLKQKQQTSQLVVDRSDRQ